jgi:molybdate transport system ATP-binding protein
VSNNLVVNARAGLGGFLLEARFQAPGDAITALFGPSGAGKSLALDLIAGVRRPDSGTVVRGQQVLDDVEAGIHVSAYRRGVGLVFQEARLFPHLDVRGNLAFAASRAPGGRGELTLARVAAHFHLEDLLDRRVRKLSGGEKARVALARALLSAPDFLLLDEPFAALDGVRRTAFLAILRGMHAEFKLPMLVVTHHIDDAVALASHLVGIQAGRVIAEGELRQIVRAPAFRGLLAPRDVGAAIATSGLQRSAVNQAQAAWVRADHVLVANAEPSGLSARNIWPGTVAALEPEPDAAVLVDLMTEAGPLFARVTVAAAAELKLSPGQKVWAIVKAHSL